MCQTALTCVCVTLHISAVLPHGRDEPGPQQRASWPGPESVVRPVRNGGEETSMMTYPEAACGKRDVFNRRANAHSAGTWPYECPLTE